MSPHIAQTPDFEDIRLVLERAETPLNSAALSKLVGQKSGKALKPVLDAEVRDGRIYSWGTNLYWSRNAQEMARERLLRLAKSEALPSKDLSKSAAAEAPKIKSSVVQNVRKELVRDNLLREVGKTKLNVNVQHPEPYLEQEIARLLADFRIERSKESIRALLAPVQAGVAEVAEKIFAAMNRIAFAPGTTVTFYLLRQQPELAQIPKPVFDKAALLLQQERRALLAEHGHAPRLLPAERDELVTDGLGTYYVSIYAR